MAAVQILSELNKSTNSRAGLHLQDFRVAINRSPDFSKYVGYRDFIAAVQMCIAVRSLRCYKESLTLTLSISCTCIRMYVC